MICPYIILSACLLSHQAVGYNAVEVDDWDEDNHSNHSNSESLGSGARAMVAGSSNGSSGSSGKGGQDSGSAGVKTGGGSEGMGRLEALLLEKNKRMEHELTQTKVKAWVGMTRDRTA